MLKSMTIEVIQVKHRADKDWDSISVSCKVWLTVKKERRIIDKLICVDCEAVGGCSGVFYESQSNPDYLIFSKFGNYDGQLIIIDTTGKIQFFFGGKYYISNNLEYIFSIYDSDLSGLTVFDLAKNKLLFSSDTLKDYLEDFFSFDNDYFAIISNDVKKDNEIDIMTIDFIEKKLIKSIVNNQYIKKAKILKVYNSCN